MCRYLDVQDGRAIFEVGNVRPYVGVAWTRTGCWHLGEVSK